MKNLEIKMVPVDSIIPYEKNARDNQKTVEALKRAIQEFGFNQPIVIDRKGVIVKGHARLEAAKQLGMTEIPCIESKNSAKVDRADRVYDNMIHDLSGWDEAGLGSEIRDIGDLMNEILGVTTVEYNIQTIEPSVTGEAMERVEAVRTASVSKEVEYVKAKCPDCGETIYLARNQVEKYRDYIKGD